MLRLERAKAPLAVPTIEAVRALLARPSSPKGAGAVRPHAPTAAGGLLLAYDANGNLTGGGLRSYVFDGDNRPTAIGQAGIATTLVYGPDGARLKTHSGVRKATKRTRLSRLPTPNGVAAHRES